MKNLNFKNFNYAMIDSTRSGYREVLVTYTVDGKTVRKCLFIKEVKGKDKNYYFAQAKKEIEASIKDGSLAKSANRQLSRGTKPALIALSCVLAAGALGTGGYFLGAYLNNGGGGGGDITKTFSVVLLPGEGSFLDGSKAYLTFKDIKKDTVLGSLDGYMVPVMDNHKEFECWTNNDGEKFDATSIIDRDLYLTASFTEGIEYYDNLTKKEIDNKKALFKDMSSLLSEDYYNACDAISKIVDDVIKAKTITNPSTAKSFNKLVNATSDFLFHLNKSYSDFKNLPTEFEQAVKESFDSTIDKQKVSTILDINAAYQKAKAYNIDYYHSYDTYLGALVEYVKNAKSDLIPLLSVLAPSTMEAAANIINNNSVDKSTFLYIFDLGVKFINSFKDLDAEETKTLFNFVNNFIVAYSKTWLFDGTQASVIEKYCMDAMDAYKKARESKTEEDVIVARFRINAMTAFADIGNFTQQNQTPNAQALAEIVGIIENTLLNLYQKGAVSKDKLDTTMNLVHLACMGARNLDPNGGDAIKSFTTIVENLLNQYLDSSCQFPNLIIKSFEALANRYNVITQQEVETTLKSTPEAIYAAKEEAQNLISSAKNDYQKELYEIVTLGRIESCAYSEFYTVSTNDKEFFPTFNVAYSNFLNECAGIAEESPKLRLLARVFAGTFVGFSKFTGLSAATIASLKQLFTTFNFDPIIKEIGGYSPDVCNFVSDGFYTILSSAPQFVSCYPVLGKAQETMKYIDKIRELVFNAIKTFGEDSTKIDNFFKECKSLYGGEKSEYVFKYYTNPLFGHVDRAKVDEENLNEMSNGEVFETLHNHQYPEKIRFDEIFDVFKEEFYAKLSKNTSRDVKVALAKRLRELVD